MALIVSRYAIFGFDVRTGKVIVGEANYRLRTYPVQIEDGRVLVDLRNVYDPAAMRQAGFDYHGIGRPAPLA